MHTRPDAFELHITIKKFYKTLWSIDLTGKIKNTIWKMSWNCLPTYANLQHKKILQNALCPRCNNEVESITHALLYCHFASEVWSGIQLSNLLLRDITDFRQWLTNSFELCSTYQKRLLCCTLWTIWSDRNSWVHEKKQRAILEMGRFIKNYIIEIDMAKIKTSHRPVAEKKWVRPHGPTVKINFDGAFSENQ